jgi:hypothetical protein
MRSAALLWAGAFFALGSFIGFIFGIPRSLSSDTSRSVIPSGHADLDTARSRTVASNAAVTNAARQHADTENDVKTLRDKLERSRQDLQALEQEAANNPNDEAVQEKVRKARQAVSDLNGKKTELDDAVLEKKDTVSLTLKQAQKDQDGLSSLVHQDAADVTINRRLSSMAVNTNLEQISDWLTKIIVGVSLVNSDKIGAAMVRTAEQISLSLGGGAERKALALALMVYFGVVGLLGGYLLTRLFLQRAFDSAGNSTQS